MNPSRINKYNVGRIAERVVTNELEYRGFRVSDLNKEGTSAKADLLAAKEGQTWQIQVKGAVQDYDGEWFGYGFCSAKAIAKEEPMFNKHTSFYKSGDRGFGLGEVPQRVFLYRDAGRKSREGCSDEFRPGISNAQEGWRHEKTRQSMDFISGSTKDE
jgi:hypothetical protein